MPRRRASAAASASVQVPLSPEPQETSPAPSGTEPVPVSSVLLYAPNLVDYARALLALGAFCFVPEGCTGLFCALYLLNMALDWLDGALARALNQRSSFGAFLDVSIDNALRAAMWSRACRGHPAGVLIPCLEWSVFVCTHCQVAAQSSPSGEGPQAQDWRELFACPPWWVARIMANGFKNPAGALTIAGLHFLPLWIWLHQRWSPSAGPWAALATRAWLAVGGALALGRGMGLAVELWVLRTHLLGLLREDARRKCQ